MRLQDRVALVTGAERGIGRGIAVGASREGAAIVVNYHQSRAQAEAVVREIEGTGGRAVAVQADVQQLEQHDWLLEAARKNFGRLDILVNNAGLGIREPFLGARPENWDRILGVNLRGAYFLSQKAARIMAAGGGGRIINIGSVHDTRPMADNSIYSISKAGLAMLTKCLALELAPHRILVNAISPGAVLTEATQVFLADEAYRARVLEMIPARRIGAVEDVVGVAVFLASADSSYVTGTTIYVDGGMLLH